MRSFEEQLRSYGEFHQHPKNRFTHYFGIPTVVFSIFLFLSAVTFPVGERTLSLAWLLLFSSSVYYLILNFKLGALITVFSLGCVIVGQRLYQHHVDSFWSIAAGTMVIGWALQFLGHYFEGKRPAFFTNLLQLLNGPLFVAHELLSRLRGR